MPVSCETAKAIALAWREIDVAEALLADISKAMDARQPPDIRDAFGRRQDGLQLGVPSGENGHRLYSVPWSMCRPIIETHIQAQKAIITILSEKAAMEAAS